MTVDAPPIATTRELVDYFREAETPFEDWRVGTEHEKVGVYEDTGARIVYEGERGIAALLERVATRDDWDRVFEEGRLIALQKDGASITLEPGGQIELSGAPLCKASETCSEFNTHVDLLKQVSEDFGVAWLGLGIDPFHSSAAAPRMPKARYDIMRKYLPTRGSMAFDMMHATATVQANFDYASESDMVSKLRLAMACTPVVSAIFANSSVAAGKSSGFISKRVHVWSDVDPDRCGLLHWVFDEGFGYEAYAEWALDVPMFFIVRDHQYLAAEGLTFRQFLEDGFRGHRATLPDWDTHLTTLFPEVRLKRFIEVRGADGSNRGLICALPALWKGLLYDADALDAAWQSVRNWTREDRESGLADVARRGLAGSIAGRGTLELAHELVEISIAGLRRLAETELADDNEERFLAPVLDQLALGKSPGEVILERWEGDWQGSWQSLMEYARY